MAHVNKAALPMALALALAVALCLGAADGAGLPYWTAVTQVGSLPAPIWDGAAAFDAENDLFYIFGGLNGTFPNDIQQKFFRVFDVQTSQWTDLSAVPDGPGPRAEAMMWVDRDGDVFVSGGRGRFRSGQDLTYNDTFTYDPDCSRWSAVPQTPAQQAIANRSTEAARGKKSTYAFSGSRSTLPAFINRDGALHDNVAVFTKVGWANLTSGQDPKPHPRAHHPLAYSKKNKALYTYGGYTNSPTGSTFAEENYLGDLWTFDLQNNSWSQSAFNVSQSPGKRDNARLLVDEENGRLWLIWGANWETTFSDIWYWDLDDGGWTRVDTQMSGTFPPATIGAFHFVRKARRAYEFFIFGGSQSEFGTLTNAMWKLTIPF